MESDFIAWLRRCVPAHPRLPLGLRDDAAVVSATGCGDIVVTSDLLTEGVDFRLHDCQAAAIGRKAVAVNLSDLAAMAARPVALLVSLALPRTGAATLARALYDGILPLAAEFEAAIAGGDTNTWDGGLVISVTALGELTARGPLRRDGAQPGDSILVTGSFGGSLLGKHLTFTPRVREALALHARYELHAGIDVSDGLSLDLSRLAAESQCGAAVKLAAIPVDPAAFELTRQQPAGPSPLEHALADGEDFELILAAAPGEAQRILQQQPLDIPITCIGRFVPQRGLWQENPDGTLAELTPRGWQHRGREK
jgi:thiamine-monophosphate kinase